MPAARKLLNELIKLSIRAAQWIDYTWDVKYSEDQSELRLFSQGPMPGHLALEGSEFSLECSEFSIHLLFHKATWHWSDQTCLGSTQPPSHWCWKIPIIHAQLKTCSSSICECGALDQIAARVEIID